MPKQTLDRIHAGAGVRLSLEALEDRWVPSPIVVNNPTDSSVAGQTDLREAIVQANSAGGDQTIVFDPTVFATPQRITLTGKQLELSDKTGTETIMGPATGVTVSGGKLSRVFQIDGRVTASLSGLTISGGKTTGSGGGLFNSGGTLTLTNCTVSGNRSTISVSDSGDGGVWSAGGTTTLTNCTLSGNSAVQDGGGLGSTGGTTTLTNCTLSGNSAARYSGGGLFSEYGTLTRPAGGERVDLGQLKANQLNVIAEADHITPPSQSERVMGRFGSPDKEVLRVRGGHIGIMAGSGAEKNTWPHIERWLAARSG